MRKSIFFYKELTPAEVGKTGTHEVYVRLPNNFDYETFFGDSASMKGSVMEVNFTAQDITNGGDESTPLRFVYFKNSNQEKRIPSLGPLFKSHNVQEGDIVCLESRIDGTSYSYYLCFYKKGEIQVNPAAVYFSKIEKDPANEPINSNVEHSLQQIFYGAPGTGKSHGIKDNDDVKSADAKNLVFRTTFHPDSDYSTFVGAYKPTMRPVADKYKAVAGKDEEIAYSFVPQAFLQAYVAAWNNPDEKVFLVIEEINRGNCAQIFGDLFQLLDRDEDGNSEYPIVADMDLAKYLSGKDENGRDVLENKDGLKDGKLKLPKNLYIWATMNTSDQSLFPIDSAFKRRWDWQYIPISEGRDKNGRSKNWKIEADTQMYSWWSFIQKINDEIYGKTNSEDKKLGYYFCKPVNGIIKVETFVSKVLFYLWNDVFKDLGDGSDNFAESYDKFYGTDIHGEVVIAKDKVQTLLDNLHVDVAEIIGEEDSDLVTEDSDSVTEESGNAYTTLSTGRDKSTYTINGEGSYVKKVVPLTTVSLYVKNNPDITASELVETWYALGTIIRQIVITKELYEQKLSKTSDPIFSKRYYSLSLPNGEVVYVYNQFTPERINDFIAKVNEQSWNILIEKVAE